MADYIDREELLKKLPQDCDNEMLDDEDYEFALGYEMSRQYAREIINSMPAVEQKHGHWIVPYCHCSICGQTSMRQGNYCDNCGAKMDEVTE